MKTKLNPGDKLHKWTVVRYDRVDERRRVRYFFRCDCGYETSLSAAAVAAGRTKQCRGCCKDDLSDRHFGKWRVLHEASDRSGRSAWWCRCECGSEHEVSAINLKNGTSTCCYDCGHKVERTKKFPQTFWAKARSQAVSRGIEWSVTEEYCWKLFECQNERCALSGVELMFGDNEPDRSASLDRIDSDQGYVEDNLQWIFKPLNVMKYRYDQSRFIELCKMVARHSN